MILSLESVKIVRMNKSSMLIIINEQRVYITRRLFNKLLEDGFLQNVYIIDHPNKMDGTLTWVAVPSIF